MMAKRNGIFALLVTFLTAGFWANQTWVIADKPEGLLDLEDELVELNEQLISAQILASRVEQVYTLFERNLALSKQDSLADDASLPFLKSLMKMMNGHGITLLNIKPKPRIEKTNYIAAPYEVIMKCSYDELGKFMAELEKSPRLVTIDEFHVKNGIERIKSNASEMDLREQIIEIHLSTLTMVKSKTKVST
jgi:Tfp pilus assembly protein PilO